MVVLNNEDSRLDVCIGNLLRYRLPNKYLVSDKFIIAVISANARDYCGPGYDEFEFTVRAHYNGDRPDLRELHHLADIFEYVSSTRFRGLYCMDMEFVCDETGEHLLARFVVTGDLLGFHHF